MGKVSRSLSMRPGIVFEYLGAPANTQRVDYFWAKMVLFLLYNCARDWQKTLWALTPFDCAREIQLMAWHTLHPRCKGKSTYT